MARPSAVVGIGQTDYRRQLDVTLDGLVRWAALEALEDAGMTFADIDAIVIGKAPDALEAVMMPELSLADALGAVGKPIHRVHTAGSVGASTAITGATLVESGRYERVLVVCYEKQSEGNATWALSGGRSGGQGAGGTFAPWIRSYISRSGAPEHIGWKIAVKDRLNALKNPHAHLRIDDISIEKVKESPMLWDPLHFLESCPSSDGAAAVVLASEDVARRSPRPPAWVVAHAKRTEFSSFPGRDTVRPVAGVDCAEALYAKAGITDPLRQIDCAELYVPFSWYEPMWLEGHLITP
jgi:acetyl-CoA C-acetyltransferase